MKLTMEFTPEELDVLWGALLLFRAELGCNDHDCADHDCERTLDLLRRVRGKMISAAAQ